MLWRTPDYVEDSAKAFICEGPSRFAFEWALVIPKLCSRFADDDCRALEREARLTKVTRQSR